MNRVSLARAVALVLALLLGSCGLVLRDYQLDTSLLDAGSCEKGQFRCSADWLTTCNETLNGWVQATACATAALCNARAGRCDACRSGEYRCVGGRLEVCGSERTGFDFVEDCGSAEQCNVNLAACGSCTPNNFQCNQGALTQCTAQGTWGPPMACSPSDRCSVPPDLKTGQCAPQACTPNTYSCNGADLQRCDKDGTVLQSIDVCATPALCEKARTGTGVVACAPPACASKSFSCNGNVLQQCNADRTAFVDFMTCSAESPCNPSGSCGKCTEGQSSCQGVALLRCNASGTFAKQQDCASPGLCDASAGVCRPPTCDNPGEGVCDPMSGALQVCSPDFEWEQTDVCDTHALCNAADRRCDEPLCGSGARRCDQNELQTCNDDRTGWRTLFNCAGQGQCDLVAENGCSGACVDGKFRCNDIFVEKCAAGVWTRVERCQSNGLCVIGTNADSAQCSPPQCNKEGQLMCDGDDVKRCQSDLTWSDTILSCDDGQCDPATGTCK